MEWILTQYATALIGAIQVNINPAYKSKELEYSLNKVGCKALIMSETYKTQNFLEIFNNVCPEASSSKPGEINSKNVPQLKNAILISKKKPK
jgi:fatty-acyl-CoA synthase